MTFYEKLSALMKESKTTAKELSEKLGIGKNQFSYWKNNGNTPKGDTIQALADYFDVSVDYLLGRTDTKKGTDPNSQSTDEQTKLIIDKFYSLDEDSQRKAVSYLEFLLASQEQSDNQ